MTEPVTLRDLENLPAVLTPGDVIEIARLSRRRVYEMLARNEIPHVRLGKSYRIPLQGLLDLLLLSGPTETDGDQVPRIDVGPWRYRLNDAASAREISTAAHHVGLALSSHMSKDGGDCFPRVDTVARETRRKTKTVRLAIAELRAVGLLQVMRGGGRSRSNTYIALAPDPHADAIRVPIDPFSDRKPGPERTPFNSERGAIESERGAIGEAKGVPEGPTTSSLTAKNSTASDFENEPEETREMTAIRELRKLGLKSSEILPMTYDEMLFAIAQGALREAGFVFTEVPSPQS